MTRSIRVLSLYEGFFAGGARILHSDVVVGLARDGSQEHRVLSLTASARRDASLQLARDDTRYRRLREAGVQIDAFDRIAGDHPIAPEDFTAAELDHAAELFADADVVLSLKEQPLSLVVALDRAGLLPDVPLAACLHRSDPTHSGPALGWLTDAAASGAVTATISCATSTSDAYAWAGVAAQEAWVIDNGINTRRFRPGTRAERRRIRSVLGIPETAPVVLLAARFDAMKDPGLFLRAVARHARRAPGTHYLLCGSGMTPDNPAFRALRAASGVASGVALHALGLREDMPELYRIADVVALTSAFGEASPLCLVEGAASGAVPVTTDVGDAARMVEGFGLVTARDVDAVVEAWEDALALRPALRAAALAARGRLDRSRMIAEYRGAISGLLRREALAA
ncbi:Glycosyltransferase involved in cell wall bisynthesis [Microbacterium sp. ru370.1]|uniref:glycosyltransferase n=1 Tax=unclassified Microbacterium TaxID=2609290 RepID=UPI000888640C|nr:MULTISPECIES: glycosyltransferase [unclassified Microbacterium]SDO97549.1 Glycosyltransferase involved in cell wall bisynthesis [Microbacterium sp. ru370.1]SIT92726.1 Glycosyltransferase involved in cell wall bisynthesis [Microbacterium sp. RU1D]